jgi:hypothetical protein
LGQPYSNFVRQGHNGFIAGIRSDIGDSRRVPFLPSSPLAALFQHPLHTADSDSHIRRSSTAEVRTARRKAVDRLRPRATRQTAALAASRSIEQAQLAKPGGAAEVAAAERKRQRQLQQARCSRHLTARR